MHCSVARDCWYKVHTLRWCFISVFVAASVPSFCLSQDTTPLRCDDHHCSSSPAQLQHLAQPRPASPAQSGPTQPAQPSTCPVAFPLSLTDSTCERFADALRTLCGRFNNDRCSTIGPPIQCSIPSTYFFDDICVARVCIRVRGPYLVKLKCTVAIKKDLEYGGFLKQEPSSSD